MFIGQFFKGNSNFGILEVLELISRTKVDLRKGETDRKFLFSIVVVVPEYVVLEVHLGLRDGL